MTTEEPLPPPEQHEEIFMQILFKISGKEKNKVSIETLKDELKSQAGLELTDEKFELLYKRLSLEGFVKQDCPGTIQILNCGNLNLEQDIE